MDWLEELVSHVEYFHKGMREVVFQKDQQAHVHRPAPVGGGWIKLNVVRKMKQDIGVAKDVPKRLADIHYKEKEAFDALAAALANPDVAQLIGGDDD